MAEKPDNGRSSDWRASFVRAINEMGTTSLLVLVLAFLVWSHMTTQQKVFERLAVSNEARLQEAKVDNEQQLKGVEARREQVAHLKRQAELATRQNELLERIARALENAERTRTN